MAKKKTVKKEAVEVTKARITTYVHGYKLIVEVSEGDNVPQKVQKAIQEKMKSLKKDGLI